MEKMLVISIFSFSNNLFKSFHLGCENFGLFYKELTPYPTIPCLNKPKKCSSMKTLWVKEKMLVSKCYHNLGKERNQLTTVSAFF